MGLIETAALGLSTSTKERLLMTSKLQKTMHAVYLALLLAWHPMHSVNAAQTEQAQVPGRPCRIMTTIYPLQIMALNVTRGVPDVQVTNLVAPDTGCLHHYNLTPNNLKALAQTDILIVNGAGMETFLEEAFKLVPKKRTIIATDGMDLIPNAENPNPHVWVAPSGAIRQVEIIAEGLARLDPERAEAYLKNATQYKNNLEGLRARMHASISKLSNRPIVTFHEAFPYFAKEFGLTIASVMESEPGISPSPKRLIQTITAIRDAKVTAIFTEPQYSSDLARTISQETNVKTYVLDPAATGPIAENAYIEIMEKNLRVLEEALK